MNKHTEKHLTQADLDRCQLRHLRFGWWSLLLFLLLGIGLELMHGLKLGWYLDVGNETRRLMWTLGHAHGALLALLNLLFAASLGTGKLQLTGSGRLASPALIGASILMPAGFLLAGIVVYGGDPGLGILLVPLGALLLALSVLLIALSVQSGANRNPPERAGSGRKST